MQKNGKVIKRKFRDKEGFFLSYFGREVEGVAIVSFGGCNFSCPYCKRGLQFVDGNGKVIHSVNVEQESLFKKIDKAIAKGQRVRLSGGDPCMFLKESLKIAKYVMEKHGGEISIAHNGSSLSLIELLSGYLGYVALGFKAFSKDTLSKITGVVNPSQTQEQILSLCEKNGILVDVRTPIFGDTSYGDLLRIGMVLSKYPNVFWTLRKYNPVTNCNFKGISDSQFEEVVKSLISGFSNVRIGSRSYWNRGFSKV